KMKGYQFLTKVANSIKTQKGVYVHVNYDINGNVNYLDVLPFKKCRVSKEDDKDNAGKIYYKDWDAKQSGFNNKASKPMFYYPFNPDKRVIMDQRKADVKNDGIKDPQVENLVTSYRGQVFFLNLDEENVYPFAWLNPAYNDCDTEFRLGVYRNAGFRNGFLDKTILIANGLDEESAKGFSEDLKKWLGSENSSSVYMMAPTESTLPLEQIIHQITLKGGY